MTDRPGSPLPTPFEDHLTAPRGRGCEPAGGHAGAAGGAACGDLVRISVRVEGDRVTEAGFDARGCAAATAAASAVVELAGGTPVLAAARLGAAEVAGALGGLSLARLHAADLAAEALHRALGRAASAGAPALRPSAGRTLVALSGGVDSAVAARLALESGHEVVGVTLELWADPDNDGERSCCSPQAVTGARDLAHRMGIPHLTLDLREAFRRSVVDDFVFEHEAGRTPNPCVRCNGLVRFDAMLRLADRLGAARLATGHYARIEHDGAGPLLAAAGDPGKDQSYMLARLRPGALERLWFPLGDMVKADVRRRARAAGLPVADRPESQDLCFLAGTGRDAFLSRHGRSPENPGEIVDRTGRVLGAHLDHRRFTVGQRRGIGVAAREPLYVLATHAPSARVTVGPRAALATTGVRLEPAVLHRQGTQVDRVKLRYRAAPVACRVEGAATAGRHSGLRLALAQPVDAAAPGQTACLMRGRAVVGWGTIAAGEERRVA